MPGCASAIANAILGCFRTRDSDTLYEKANAFYRDYLSSNDHKDLKNALQNYRSAVSARVKENHPDLAATYVNYATALWAEYERSGEPPDKLPEIIRLDEAALLLWREASPKPQGYPVLLLNLATAYFNQYRGKPNADSFKRAIELYDELRKRQGVSTDTRRKGLMRMGIALSWRCDVDQTTDRLDEAIDYLEEALTLSKPAKSKVDDEKGGENGKDIAAIRIGCLYNLATAYDARFQLGKPQGPRDLDKAIEYYYQARTELPEHHTDRVPCLYNLAKQLFFRYERAQKEKAGPVLLGNGLDPTRGVRDLRNAKEIAEEAQKLLTNADASTEQKESVDELLRVVNEHSANVSREASSGPSRAHTPNV